MGHDQASLMAANGARIGHLSFITEGLKQAVEEGWITNEEAKKEVRAMLPQTRHADQQRKTAKELRDEADGIEEELDNS